MCSLVCALPQPLSASRALPSNLPLLLTTTLHVHLHLAPTNRSGVSAHRAPLRSASRAALVVRSSPAMAASENSGGSPPALTEYEEALNCLSSLITRRIRADGSNRGDQFDLMFDYLKILELDEPISQLKVIHVAGTKGKGSTCTFTESILRACGFRTGLFTSPHLIDVRERFRLDGEEISEDKFLKHFWWCWKKLQEKTNDDIPMPPYFRFLALLAFKIFSAEQVDVVILEVGLGGKFDATNVVQTPIVCGITSLGYDHMEILGNTLGEIAGEKAGIFKKGIPAYSVPQPQEAMSVLEDKASQLGVPLHVISPLDSEVLKGRHLGLDGEHQYINAGLAIALSNAWLRTTGHIDGMNFDHSTIPEQFITGLSRANLQGRAQIIPVQEEGLSSRHLVFYLDGAHSPESLEMCARWFSNAVKEDTQSLNTMKENNGDNQTRQVLLFNCMSVRDPQMLLPPLVNTCSRYGVNFHKALFVPNQSLYFKVGSHVSTPADPQQVDLSWQSNLQKVWESLNNGEKGSASRKVYGESLVLPSLPLAIKWLRETIQQNRSIRYQVLVTGSLHLVGDVIKLIKR